MFNSAHYWRMQSLIQYHLVQQALQQSHTACTVNVDRVPVASVSDDYSSGNEGSTTSSVDKSPTKKKMCRFCPAIFKSNTDVRRHERTHTGEKPFKCDVCDKEFNRKGNMEKHMTTHFKGKDRFTYLMNHSIAKPYICPCGKSFRSKGFFDRHQRKHETEARRTSDELYSPERYISKPSPVRPNPLRLLPKFETSHEDMFKQQRDLLQQYEEPNSDFFKCHACDLKFTTATKLTEHFTKCSSFAGPIQVDCFDIEEINVD